MTDNRIEKIRAEIERVKKNQEGVFTSYTDGKFDLCEHLLSFIDSMQEEPKECMYSKDNYTDEDRKVLCDGCEEKCKHDKSDDFTKALAECIHNAQCNVIDPMVFAEIWKDELIKLSKCEEPVSEDLGEYINELSKQFPEASFAKLSRIAVRVAKWQKEKEYTCYEEAFKDGAKWKVENLWKPADGEDLPEIDREVIVLIKYYAQHNIHDKEYSTYRVGFGHRPNPDGWNGKNIDTNEVTHYTPKLYDKGGWNAPDIVYWLDVKLPKEIEL